MRRAHQMSVAPSERLRIKNLRNIAPRLVGLAWPHRALLLLGLITLALGSGINLLFPYLLRKLLNNELGISLSQDLTYIALALVALFALQAAMFYLRHLSFAIVGYRVVSALRTSLFTSTINQDIAFFDRARVGDLLSRLSSDTQLVQNAVTTNISVALRYALQIVGGIVLMISISWRLTCVILFLIPITMLAGRFWGSRLAAASRKMQDALGEASVVAEEGLSAIRTVRVFAGSSYESKRYDRSITRALDAGTHRARIAAIFSSSMVFIMHSSIALVLWYGGRLVQHSALTLGDLSAFILYCVIVAVSFGFLISAFDEFMQAVGAGERIFEILDFKPTVTSPEQALEPARDYPNRIEFRNVSFHYPTRPEVTVLSDLSFVIPEGRTVALVGPSGSGKSTVAALIPRFYDPTVGEVRYTGVPLKQVSLDAMRGEISVVSQDVQVFSISIGENIRYGRPQATHQEVEQAARDANIDTFINSLPEGYDTLVGDRGVQLSGGQRQRIAIARALLKDPKLLILDEATSALDSENEQLVQQALQRLMAGRSTLIIAHRLSTVQHADEVLVLKEGRVIQRGNHESLIAEGGLYRSLVEAQML